MKCYPISVDKMVWHPKIFISVYENSLFETI